MTCELVISGWYASNEPRNYVTVGDDLIRGVAFRPLWWRSLDTFIRPAHVFIVDSASPAKPNDVDFTSTKFQRVELLRNPGHAQNGNTHYCGYMAGVILGLEFAMHNDVDMLLYVEQDALVFGDSIIAKTKNALRRKDLVFGGGSGLGIQQSFFAANRRGIRHFLRALHGINYSDRQIAPEHKFMFAATRFLPAPLIGLAVHTENDSVRKAGVRLFSLICSGAGNYELLPFGYGRDRPINFNDEVFYFQQGSTDEIREYKMRTGF
jgi:hypothetical protein